MRVYRFKTLELCEISSSPDLILEGVRPVANAASTGNRAVLRRGYYISAPVGSEQVAGLEKLPSPAMPMATYRDEPQDAVDYNLRGLAYYQHGEYQQAILDLNQAILLDPQYAEAYNNRGAAYGDLGHHRRAIQDYDQAISLDPQLTLAYKNRGVSYTILNQHQRAIEDLNQAILLDPEDAQAYANRAISYTFLRQDTEAQVDTERSVALGFDRAFLESAIEEAKWQRVPIGLSDSTGRRMPRRRQIHPG